MSGDVVHRIIEGPPDEYRKALISPFLLVTQRAVDINLLPIAVEVQCASFIGDRYFPEGVFFVVVQFDDARDADLLADSYGLGPVLADWKNWTRSGEVTFHSTTFGLRVFGPRPVGYNPEAKP